LAIFNRLRPFRIFHRFWDLNLSIRGALEAASGITAICRRNLTYRRRQILSGEMRAQIVDHEPSDCRSCLQCGAAVMRLYDDIGKPQQFGCGIRLALEYVERGVAEPPCGERPDEGLLVDHAAA